MMLDGSEIQDPKYHRGAVKKNRTVRNFLMIILVWYFLASMGFWAIHEDVVYSAVKRIENTPADIGLHYVDLFLETPDGVVVNAWYVPFEGTDYTILYCHGNACNMGGSLSFPKMFHSMGISTMMLDYRGFGRSEGEPSEEETYLDVRAAWDHLVDVEGIDPEKIIVYGRSLGGPIAASLARDVSPAAFIMESTFTSIPGELKDTFFWLPLGLIVDLEYPTLEHLSNAERPLLVIHGRDDITVKEHHARELFQSYKGDKMYLELPGNHDNVISRNKEAFMEGVRSFLEEFVFDRSLS